MWVLPVGFYISLSFSTCNSMFPKIHYGKARIWWTSSIKTNVMTVMCDVMEADFFSRLEYFADEVFFYEWLENLSIVRFIVLKTFFVIL